MECFATPDFPSQRPTFATLYSGSSGNAVYLRCRDTEILIDEGKSTRATEEALQRIGSSLSRISAIFVTHEHSDHTAGLAVTARKYRIPIYLPARCFDAIPEGSRPETAVPLPAIFEQEVGAFRVRSFFTPHDSAMSVGYLAEGDGRRFGVATDMGILCREVVDALQGCDAALIESNYDRDMLLRGPYPPSLKERILSDRGHLSNEHAALLAAVLSHGGTKKLLLGHLSAENNRPELVYGAAKAELARRSLSETDFTVADRFRPTVLL